jgi:hypothetical protein
MVPGLGWFVMGALLSRIRVSVDVNSSSFVGALRHRTGLEWDGVDEVLSDGTHQLLLSAPSLDWEVRIVSTKQLGVYEVESVPTHWLSSAYEFWQVVAELVKLGGVHVSRDGKEAAVRLPKWIDTKWSELSWWSRLGGKGTPRSS